jgi:hypothetical protein
LHQECDVFPRLQASARSQLGVNGSVALVVAKKKLTILGLREARAGSASVHAAKVIGRNFDVDGFPLAGIAHIFLYVIPFNWGVK